MRSADDAERKPVSLQLLSEAQLAISEGVLRPYQVVATLDECGEKLTEYSRYLSSDDARWVRHGVFQQFGPGGSLLSQGQFRHGVEDGLWRDFHQNGATAAEGQYRQGKEIGVWKYWSPDGEPESSEDFGSESR